MDSKGYLILVFHAHLPFIYRANSPDNLEERWYYEALTESYLPFVSMLEQLQADSVPFAVTLSLSPTLLAMLDHPVMSRRYDDYLLRLIGLAESETKRTRGSNELNSLAHFYLDRFQWLHRLYRERYQGDLPAVLSQLSNQGCVELITTCATHGYLPLMKTAEAVKAQVGIGLDAFKKRFGYRPRGIWLPECAYFPQLDRILKEFGVEYLFMESHGMRNALPTPLHDVYLPLETPSVVAVFARDTETSAQVWSIESGYPGDPEYREYFRDIGFDLDEAYIRKFLPYDVRVNTGLKYFRVTGKDAEKQFYRPKRAEERATEHADNFHFNRERQIEYLSKHCTRPPVITAPYDAELFGHWWFEGPVFLDRLARKAAAHPEIYQLTTPSRYLDECGCAAKAEFYHSSWGEGGYSKTWLNPATDWLYPRCHKAEDSIAVHNARQNAGVLEGRARKQAARELLLAQSSDWAFMITAGTTAEYACNRAISHLENFQQLDTMINVGVIDQKKLLKLEEETQGLFPDINVSYFNPEIHNDDRYKDRPGPATLMLSWEYPPRIMGGLARHVDDLSHALAGMGQPVSVLTTRSGSSPVFEEDGDVRVYRGAPYQEAGREINFYGWVVQLNLVFFNMAQKIIPLNQAMVLHAHDWLVGTAARAIQRAWGIPLIATIHATEYGRNGGLHTPLQRKIHRQEKELVEAADRVICCSNYMAAEVVRLFEIPREKVAVIGNGVFTHKVAALPLTGDKRRRYVLDDESLIFFVGRLVKEKGVDVLLRALPRVFAEHPRAKAVISGRGPMFFELQKQAENYGISERVLFTGFVDDEERNKLLASADIAVFPSFYEPFGIVALEAMAAGTPVIVSDVGGMGDVVEDGVDGLKFTPGDDEKLARAILLLLSDHNFSDLLRQNGKITAATSYSWHALAGLTQKLYHHVWQEVQQKRDQLREVN